MPNVAINGAVSTRVQSSSFQQTSSTFSVSSLGNPDPSGAKYILAKQIRMAVSGKGSSRTIALGLWDSELNLLGRTNNFTVAASTYALRTRYNNFQSPFLIDTNAEETIRAGFWVSGKGGVFIQTDRTNQTGQIINYDATTQPTITDFTDSGTYSFGSDASLIGNLDYDTLPGVPSSLTPVVTADSITINWAAPIDNGGASVTSYVVQTADDESFTTNLVTLTGVTQTTYTQEPTVFPMPGESSGLPYKAYYYRVAAVNSVATEASTTGAYATVGPIYPNFRTSTGGVVDPVTPAAPTNLLFTPSGVETSVNLSWTAPVFDGDATITNYTVRYNAVGSASSTTVLTGSTSTSYTLTGLPKSTNFEIDVAAVNSVGTGPYSNKVDAYTLVVSTEVGLIKTYDSAAGGWRVLV
jgi:hypothetical protein